jgi:hypothetical protein
MISARFNPIIDEMAVKIANFSMYLQWLKIDGLFLSDMSMIKVAEGCPKIQHLSISHCPNITDVRML